MNSLVVSHSHSHRSRLDAFQCRVTCSEAIGPLTRINPQETEKRGGAIDCVGCVLKSCQVE